MYNFFYCAKIGILILVVSIVTGIVSVGVMGYLTRTDKKSSLSSTLIAGFFKSGGSIATLNPETKSALKTQFAGMDSSEKDALIQKYKETAGK